MADIQSKADLTFKVLDGLNVHDCDGRQSLLNGSIIRHCTFRNVNFARADLEQVQIQDCTFESVDFRNVELNSARIIGSRFEQCDFDSALISDCVWQKCQLINSSFQTSVFHRSMIEDCLLQTVRLRGASIQLNTFRKCAIQDTTLGDCTFLGEIMIQCEFAKVTVNLESIGSIFGITEADLISFGLIYLGQPVTHVETAGQLLDSLEDDYSRRRWFFAQDVLRLNFERVSTREGLRACLESVLWPASLELPLKGMDIEFLNRIVSELSLQGRLPGSTLLTMPDQIKQFLDSLGTIGQEGQGVPALRQLATQLRLQFMERLNNISLRMSESGVCERDESVVAKLVFERKPEVDVTAFMNAVASISSFSIKHQTKIVSERQGSYEVILKTTLLTLAALQLALWLVNGCVVQVIELKSRLTLISKKRLPKSLRDRAILPGQDVPRWMAVAVNALFSGLAGNLKQLSDPAAEIAASDLQRLECLPKKAPRRKNGGTTS